MADLAWDRLIFERSHDLCFVCERPFLPWEDVPHMCTPMPFDEATIRALVPDDFERSAPFASRIAPRKVKRQRERNALLAWDWSHARKATVDLRDELQAPRPATIGDLLTAGACAVAAVAHGLGYVESQQLAERVYAALRERGLDWAVPGGHRWVAVPYNGMPAPHHRAGQIWARCACWRSGFQPPSRVTILRTAESNSEVKESK